MLKRYGTTEANTSTTPSDVNVKLVKNDNVSKEVDPVLYQSMVEILLYIAMATHPDIAHATLCSKENFEIPKRKLTEIQERIQFSNYIFRCRLGRRP